MLVALLLGLVIVVQLAVTLLILIESRRTKKIEQKIFTVVSLTIMLWTICNIILVFVESATSNTLPFYIIINRIAFTLGTASLLAIYVFSLVYPIKRKINKIQKGIIGFGVATMVLAPLNIVAGEFVIASNQVLYQSGPAAILIGVLAIITIADVFIDDSKIFRHTTDRHLKRQAITLLLGLSLTIAHALIFIILLPPILGLQQSTALYIVGYAAPSYLLIGAVYGLLRQGLFDIRAIIARAVGYILSLVVIGASASLLLVGLSGQFAQRGLPLIYQQLFFVSAALLLAILYQPLKRFFDKITNKLFFRDAYDSQALLNDLNASLVSIIELDKILQQTALALQNYLKTVHVSFIIQSQKDEQYYSYAKQEGRYNKEAAWKLLQKTSEKIISVAEIKNEKVHAQLLENDISLAVQIVSGIHVDERIGFIILGPKLSGKPFSKQDTRVLEIIADELVIAIQNALRFEEIQQFNITLQAKVDKATGELRKANTKLIAMDQTKDDFISMASHQLRTPLTSVKGYVSMVLEGDVGKITKDQRKLLDQAFLSSQRMVYLIADLLNVSRLKTGKFIIESKPTNLADVVEAELEQLKETAAARQLELKYDKPKDFPVLNLDDTKIRQVIMNFADNAIYYTPAGGHIEVAVADKGKTIEFTVSDDGIGVPKSEQHNLFNKFYRAGNARKARPDGTGLGLFMAKKVVIAQGGSIIFKTQEGKGSTFGFSFEKAKLKAGTHSVNFEDTEE